MAQQAADANAKKIAAEKDALHKEVDRLRHIEQLRSIPNTAAYSFTQQNDVEQSG